MRLSRSVTKERLIQQYQGHVKFCPPKMDVIMYALSSWSLDHLFHYFIVGVVKKYLENPTFYVVEEGMSFEDLCIIQLCKYIAD